MKKIAILIPSTSRGRTWETAKETYLYHLSIMSFLLTYDKEHLYKFFIGVDKFDKIYNDHKVKKEFNRLISVMKNVEIEFVMMKKVSKGHVTIMWNQLFKKSYNDGYDYFFQCGDDIQFKTKGWVNECIKILEQHDNMGVTGPGNNNNRILTQSFVSRKHMEIFGFYFPPKIINWCCDDWINFVYKPNFFYPAIKHLCLNLGGQHRYVINNDRSFYDDFINNRTKLREKCGEIIEKDKKKIIEYLNK